MIGDNRASLWQQAGRPGDGRLSPASTPAPAPDSGSSREPQRPRDELTLRAIVYIGLVVLVGLAAIGYYGPQLAPSELSGLIILGIFSAIFDRYGVHIYGNTMVSVGLAGYFAIAVLYGPAGIVAIVPVAILLVELFSGSPWYRRLFDVGLATISLVAAAEVFQHLLGADAERTTGWMVPAALVALTANYAVNISLLTLAVSLTTGERPWDIWKEKFQWGFPHHLIVGLLGLALAAGYRALGLVGILAFVAPPLMMRLAIRQYILKTAQHVEELKRTNLELETANREIRQVSDELRETYDGTLVALVSALDARDRETKGHSTRVTRYMMDMARLLGVTEGTKEWLDMQRGALLHDVGKIGVRDFVLHKPGKLTPEEWTEMRRHPEMGFEMLRDISFLAGAAEVVLSHHERFDGKGYPHGLQGKEIPIGARIFAVADTFDAMTSDRPYRKALPWEESRLEIIRNSGSQFDPVVVDAFLVAYEDWLREREQEQAPVPEEARAA